jgi:hypothetical protein
MGPNQSEMQPPEKKSNRRRVTIQEDPVEQTDEKELLIKQLANEGIKVTGYHTTADLRDMLAAVSGDPLPRTPPPATPKLPPQPKRRVPVSESSTKPIVSPATKLIARKWKALAKKPELPRKPRGPLQRRQPSYLSIGSINTGETFMDAMNDRMEREAAAQAVRVKLNKMLPGQRFAQSTETPAFGAITPGFGLDPLSPSDPVTLSPPLREAPDLVEIVRIGNQEFTVGERVQFGTKEGFVMGLASDGIQAHQGQSRTPSAPGYQDRYNLFSNKHRLA